MALTEEETKEKLKQLPEIDLLEILNIDSEMIVDRFWDIIEDRQDYFIKDLETEDWEDEDSPPW